MQGFQKTGLGERVANLFVAACGKSTLGLAYGLSIAEACLAPAMPSTTARAGGIFMPIINSLALASGSEPGELLLVLICPFARFWSISCLYTMLMAHPRSREECSSEESCMHMQQLSPTRAWTCGVICVISPYEWCA